MAMTERNSPKLAKDWEDVRGYSLDGADENELLDRQTECTFMWTAADGHPVGVIVNFIFRSGHFWLTASSMRKRIAAVRRDPRVCIAVSSKGSGIGHRRSLSYTGQCLLHDDDDTKAWFYPDFAAAMRPGDPERASAFATFLDSPSRLILEVVPNTRIGYDGAKMWAASPSAQPR
jgi:hypothetical protein